MNETGIQLKHPIQPFAGWTPGMWGGVLSIIVTQAFVVIAARLKSPEMIGFIGVTSIEVCALFFIVGILLTLGWPNHNRYQRLVGVILNMSPICLFIVSMNVMQILLKFPIDDN